MCWSPVGFIHLETYARQFLKIVLSICKILTLLIHVVFFNLSILLPFSINVMLFCLFSVLLLIFLYPHSLILQHFFFVV